MVNQIYILNFMLFKQKYNKILIRGCHFFATGDIFFATGVIFFCTLVYHTYIEETRRRKSKLKVSETGLDFCIIFETSMDFHNLYY